VRAERGGFGSRGSAGSKIHRGMMCPRPRIPARSGASTNAAEQAMLSGFAS